MITSTGNTFADKCGINTEARQAEVQRVLALAQASGLTWVRLVWCDVHGSLRGKTWVTSELAHAFAQGMGMVSTLMLKDTSDRTVYKVFEADVKHELPGFEGASNLMLLPDPSTFKILPWAEKTGWLLCQPWFPNGQVVPYDSRRILQAALEKLAAKGWGMRCGLEVEFHIYKLQDAEHGDDADPAQAAWPGPAPAVSMIHPGYNLLNELWFDRAEPALRIVKQTAQDVGLPLLSLEIELGPSQVEAVFKATDALTAADNMVLFRSAVKQALRRAGYHATFMCRPPFENIMSSGWHLHQSLYDLQTNQNLFARTTSQDIQEAQSLRADDARHTLSNTGAHYLAGLLEHGQGMTSLCTTTVNGFGRFKPNALAPQSILWGRDNRGAMLRVVGGPGDAGTRIENRMGEPAANPYLYMASQILAGLDGIDNELTAPFATEAPYAESAERLPLTLGDALARLGDDPILSAGLGADFVRYYQRIKQSEQSRFNDAEDKVEFQRREYFSRI
ncbi:MAG: glutamine synthetase [Betaproteobacteria bacterium]|nr:glutamine synthetase [Betaproteobacteria bacterium]